MSNPHQPSKESERTELCLSPEELEREIGRTRPDFVTYVPKALDGSCGDSANEHFLVFEGKGDWFYAVWTQAVIEGDGGHRIMFARSPDGGVTWEEPECVAGPELHPKGWQASWAYPLVSRSGRIYLLWNQYQGIEDCHHPKTGTWDGRYSDDGGKSWSEPETMPVRRSIWDHPDPKYPANAIIWQRPDRLSEGKYFAGLTRWVSKAVRRPLVKNEEGKSIFWSEESVTEFVRFENVDDDPEVRDLKLSWFAQDHHALKVPYYTDPLNWVAQEPSVVALPDGRLFCVMRTMTGYIWYSVSSDAGRTWCSARPLLRQDHGRVIEEPICCCPIYQLSDGRYVLIHHLRHNGYKYEDSSRNRRPAYVAVGEFRPEAEQPLWFSESRVLMDNDNVGVGPRQYNAVGIYSSFTTGGGRDVLWHPDRKTFLLGKIITPEILEGLKAPEPL